jgi:hypothetical protein
MVGLDGFSYTIFESLVLTIDSFLLSILLADIKNNLLFASLA